MITAIVVVVAAVSVFGAAVAGAAKAVGTGAARAVVIALSGDPDVVATLNPGGLVEIATTTGRLYLHTKETASSFIVRTAAPAFAARSTLRLQMEGVFRKRKAVFAGDDDGVRADGSDERVVAALLANAELRGAARRLMIEHDVWSIDVDTGCTVRMPAPRRVQSEPLKRLVLDIARVCAALEAFAATLPADLPPPAEPLDAIARTSSPPIVVVPSAEGAASGAPVAVPVVTEERR